MMQFEKIKQALITTLGDDAATRYRVVGYQKQTEDAADFKDEDRVVQLFYSAGQFPKSASSLNGPFQHQMTFRVELSVAKAAEVDVATLTNPASTDVQRALAMQCFMESSALADAAWDEMAGIVFQVLTDARNIDFGLGKGVLSNRWADQLKKDEPVTDGEFAIITGSMMFTCQACEVALGDDSGVTDLKKIKTVIDIEGDDNEQTAVEQETT